MEIILGQVAEGGRRIGKALNFFLKLSFFPSSDNLCHFSCVQLIATQQTPSRRQCPKVCAVSISQSLKNVQKDCISIGKSRDPTHFHRETTTSWAATVIPAPGHYSAVEPVPLTCLF
uniref:Uncharacterized protein n=1 Tax=Amphiprion ocellaris TaxID=80972 RepID=A0A3Q1CAV9_AMPOC